MNVEFWFEFASTYSYPAAIRIEKLASSAGAGVLWRPFLLGPIFAKQGWDTSPFNIYEAKGRYMWRDLERICEDLGIPFRKPTVFPRNGLLAARIACAHAAESWAGNFIKGVYVENFVHDRDISDKAVLGSLLATLGQDPSAVIETSQKPESKALLRAQADEAVRLGIFGSPMVRVGEELFWGNDRLETAMRWLGR